MTILFIIAGIVSGVVAGMGMGGGTFLIPILTIFLKFKQQAAQGLNLLAFLPCAIVSLVIHCKNKLVNFKIGIPIIITGVFASVSGSLLAMHISSVVLKKLFGGFLLIIGLFQFYLVFKNKKSNKNNTSKPKFKVIIGNFKSLK